MVFGGPGFGGIGGPGFGGPGFGGPSFGGRGNRRIGRALGRGFGPGYTGYDMSGNVPVYRGERPNAVSIDAMAQQNNWEVSNEFPHYDDGSPLDLSGGPFAQGQWTPQPPIVQGQAGYWLFWACTVSARTRGDNIRPYALTFMQAGGLLPFVHIYPESWRASITSVTPEVDLESGEFNDKFSVFAKDAQTVYGLLNPRAMQLLIDMPPLDEVWTAGQFVCVSRVDPHQSEALGAHLTILTTIMGGIPTSLFERD